MNGYEERREREGWSKRYEEEREEERMDGREKGNNGIEARWE